MYVIWFRDVSGHLTISARNAAERYSASASAVNDGKWHHVAAVFASNTDRRLYIDGVLEASNDSSVPFASTIDEWTIGYASDSSPGGSYEGLIGPTALYNRELTQADCISLTRDPLQVFRPEPIELWGALVGGSGGTSHALAGSVAATSSVSGSLSVSKTLSTSVSGQTSVAGSVGVGRDIVGSTGEQTALSGALSVARSLAGSVSVQTSVTAALAATKPVAGSSAASAALSGALAVNRSLAGSITGQTNVTGTLSAQGQVSLAGSVSVQTSVTAALATAKPVAGSSAASTALSGALAVNRSLAGSITGQTHVTGATAVVRSLAGQVTAVATPSGAVTVRWSVAATVSARANLQGRLLDGNEADVFLAASIEALTSCVAAVRIFRGPAGQAAVLGSMARADADAVLDDLPAESALYTPADGPARSIQILVDRQAPSLQDKPRRQVRPLRIWAKNETGAGLGSAEVDRRDTVTVAKHYGAAPVPMRVVRRISQSDGWTELELL